MRALFLPCSWMATFSLCPHMAGREGRREGGRKGGREGRMEGGRERALISPHKDINSIRIRSYSYDLIKVLSPNIVTLGAEGGCANLQSITDPHSHLQRRYLSLHHGQEHLPWTSLLPLTINSAVKTLPKMRSIKYQCARKNKKCFEKKGFHSKIGLG